MRWSSMHQIVSFPPELISLMLNMELGFSLPEVVINLQRHDVFGPRKIPFPTRHIANHDQMIRRYITLMFGKAASYVKDPFACLHRLQSLSVSASESKHSLSDFR
eukprot:TRINITY_DN5112_c1_g1_i1.p1 TRINITY_DN5112_c1_g1~~TRINITY_DN5112_c1_g1_i1.p1  ORF type:complete len:105 (+),score=6.20 TRINITY_DN5112_c1_g1_i1:96-410(+)